MVKAASVLELSREEIVARMDSEARLRLGMSAEQLVKAYSSGKLKSCGKVADILALANLLDPSDPLFVEV